MFKLGRDIATIPPNITPWLSLTYDLVIFNKNSYLFRPKNIRSSQTWFSNLENDKIIIQVYVLKQDILLLHTLLAAPL